MKHTRQDLKIMQGWSLERKIRVTQTRIMEWYMRYDGQVFISFSGGKDSTVLLDLARRVYPDIPAVYVDTGLEYPELRDFVKTKDNVIWLRPRYPFTQILEKYGYPIISKEISDVINGARKGQPYRLARINGELLDKNGKKSIYNCENYKYLLDAPFKISARCCYHMKKAPLNKFERQTGRHPITGVLACESKLREQSWIKFGCNGFERQRPLSQPLAFWLEEDILRYLKMTGIPYKDDFGRSIYLCFLGLYCRMCNRTAVEQAPVRFPYYRTLSLCDMEFARNLFDCHYSVCYSGGGCRCVCSGKENQEYFCNRNYQ